jgi:hypothetical protein
MAALPPTIIVHDHRDPTYDGTPQVPEPPTSEQVNAQSMETQAAQALTQLRSFVALSSPTAAQVATAVKVLCRCMTFLIRRQLNQLDATG